MLQSNPSLCQTIGIELETENLLPSRISNFFAYGGGWRHSHDASIETDMGVFNNTEIIFEVPDNIIVPPYNRITVGSELVSSILDSESDDLFNELVALTSFIENSGESPYSNRAGLHIHVSLPNPGVGVLKTILRLGGYFESLFFHIGGMGYQYRGIKNDSTYCRPITKNGPPCVPYKRSLAPCFSFEDLTQMKRFSQEMFWEMYGDLYNHSDRYTPVRYTWLNLYNLFPGNYRGTLEFRVFNKCLNPYFIYAVIKLCVEFTRLSVKFGLRELRSEQLIEQNSVFDDNDTFNLLERFKDISSLDGEVYLTLMDILKRTPKVILADVPVKSHLLDRRTVPSFWSSSNYYPKTVYSSSKVKNPDFVDIHTLRG